MKSVQLPLLELGLIGGTRGALGAGLGLLLADRLSFRQRRTIGWGLFLIGVLSTIPLGLNIRSRLTTSGAEESDQFSDARSEAEALAFAQR